VGDTAASGSGGHRSTASELPGGVSRRLTDAGRKKNESKGGGKWNTGVVIGAGEACDGSGVVGARQQQPLVQLEVHWCSRRSLENVRLGILLHTGLLSSAEDSPRCVTRVQAQIEF